jgi:prepilin signal peptidase PulO-like enzyme (type II secretory pathway)
MNFLFLFISFLVAFTTFIVGGIPLILESKNPKYRELFLKKELPPRIILSVLSFLVNFYILNAFSDFDFRIILILIVWNIISLFIFFLVFYDLFFMEIPLIPGFITLAIIFIASLFAKNGLEIWNNADLELGRIVLGGIIAAGIIALIVLVSKRKAMGEGDILAAGIAGMLAQYGNLILWAYLSIFSAAAVGIIISINKKKFRGLKLPFIPFLLVSSLIVITFNQEIHQFLSENFPFLTIFDY